jgi:hypothetical protein
MIVSYLPYPVGPEASRQLDANKERHSPAGHAHVGAADRCAAQLGSKALPIGEVEWKPYHSRRSLRRARFGTLAHSPARLHPSATYHLIASFKPSPTGWVGS